jgi:hypothetical protein
MFNDVTGSGDFTDRIIKSRQLEVIGLRSAKRKPKKRRAADT